MIERLEAALAQEGLEAGLEEIIARDIHLIAGIAHHDGAQVLEFGGGEAHRAIISAFGGLTEGIVAKRRISAGMASRDKTLPARPPWTTAPGMPQMTLVALS